MKGTIKELISQGIKVNNSVVTPLELNTLLNFAAKNGAAKKVGEQKHASGKGKAATIWEITGELNLKFSI